MITYVFNRPLDPGRVPSGSKFGYVQADGAQVRETGAPIAGRAVAVRFASSVDDDVRQYVVGGAVETQTQDVQNPPGAVGAAVPTSPTIASATRSTFAGSYDVTYDQPVTAKDRSKFAAYREDNSTVPGAPPAVTTLGPTTLRLSYPQSPTRKLLDVAKYASKVVRSSIWAARSGRRGPAPTRAS